MQIEENEAAAAGPTLEQARELCREAVDVTTLYAHLGHRGIDFGEEFRVLHRVWRGPDQAVGEVMLGPDLAGQTGTYHVHPALLDGCLQAIAAAISSENNDELYVPFAIGRYALRRRAGSHCFSHAIIDAAEGDVRRATITVFDDDGSIVAELLDVRLKRVVRDALGRRGGRGLDDCLYETRWVQLPAAQSRPFGEHDPARLAHAAAARLGELCAAADIAGYDTFLPRFEAVCVDFIVVAMLQLGWRPAIGEMVTGEVLAERLNIAGRHRRLFERLLRIMAEAGWLARDVVGWRVVRALVDRAPRAQLARLGLDCPAGAEAELELTDRVASELAPALRGECDPMQLLFPDGKLDAAERLYRDAPVGRVFGGLMAEVAAAVGRAGHPLRILEVGAGTGGTTAHVLPKLPAHCVEYCFTDIGPIFVARARERFGAYPFMRFQVLDLERDDHIAALGDARFDLVIAANVIHATADVRETLARIRRLLRPGGILAIFEVTAAQRWFDLTVGLTEGWWAFTDNLRTDYATLTREQWLQLLPGCGFESVEALPAAGQNGAMALQSLLLSRTASAGARNWLLFSDDNGVAAGIAERLTSRGDRCTLVRAGAFSANLHTSRLDPAQLADYQRLLEALNTPDHPIHGVVHAWSIDVGGGDAFAARGVTSAMLLAKALLRCNPSPRLWIITRGGQYVGAKDRMLFPSQAPLWGLARSIAIEHPELACVAIDLDSVDGDAAELDAIVGMLVNPDGENQLALRSERRLAARVVRRPPGNAITTSLMPWRLEPETFGALERFCQSPLNRRPPGPGEIEIAVEASGTQFQGCPQCARYVSRRSGSARRRMRRPHHRCGCWCKQLPQR